jgi:GAF domain-containing protein
VIRGGRTTTAPGARRAPERWLAAALRLAEQPSAAALYRVAVAEVARLLGARAVLLATEAPSGRVLAGARVPRGDDAGALLALVAPWLDEAGRSRSARLRHGPEGAAVRAQRSCLVAPLTIGVEVLGVVYADIDGASGRFDDEHCTLLATLARHAAIALVRLRDGHSATAQTLAAGKTDLNAAKAWVDERAGLRIVNLVQQGMAAELNLLARGDPDGASSPDAALAGDIGLRWSDHGPGLAHYRFLYEPGRFLLEPVRRSDDSALMHALRSASGPRLARTKAELASWRLDGDAATPPPRSILVAPIVGREGLLGSVAMEDARAGAFGDAEIALLGSVAASMATALENERLFAETERLRKETEQRNAELAVINSIQEGIAGSLSFQAIVELVGDKLRDVLRIDTIGIRWYDHETRTAHFLYEIEHGVRVTMAPVTASEARWKEVTSDRSVIVRNTAAEVAAAGVAPGTECSLSSLTAKIVAGDRVVGVVIVESFEREHAFGDSDVRLLQTIVASMGVALENVRLFDETREALERQTATADILKVISGSPTDTQPVFDAIVQSAARLFGRKAALRTRGPEGLRRVARSYEVGPDEFHGAELMPVDRESLVGRAVLDGKAQQVADISSSDSVPYAKANSRKLAYRAVASAPLMLEGSAIGVISVTSSVPGALPAQQMELLSTFADQAVIAIQNTRLFNETRDALRKVEQRTAELTESLDYQTAISDVLRVISQSPTDVAPVFEAILDCATRLFGSAVAAIYRYDGRLVSLVATRNWPAEALAMAHSIYPAPADQAQLAGRAILTAKVQSLDDALTDPSYNHAFAAAGSWRRVMGAPMLKDGVPVGAILVGWPDAGRTAMRQIELIKTFADQAVIAIENVRLLNETKEALERQTATAEILRVISSSPTDVQPVFDAIAERARVLCGARVGVTTRFDGELMHMVGYHGTSPEAEAAMRASFPMKPGRGSINGRAILAKAPAQIADIRIDPDYALKAAADQGDWRSAVAVPMIFKGEVIGSVAVTRAEPGLFSAKLVMLLQTFADQAVIAIQNARLFNETREALDQQTATGAILAAMSESMTDAHPVFDAIARNLLRLFDTQFAIVALARDGKIELAGHQGALGFEKFDKHYPLPLDASTHVGRAILTGETSQVVPLIDNPEAPPRTAQFAREYGFNAQIAAPMIREGKVIGAIVTAHRDAVPFTDKQVALIKSFAAQAVIAVENVRLFNETKEALEQQTATAKVLQVISQSPTDVQPVFEAILERALALCDARIGGVGRYDGELVHLAAFDGGSPEATAMMRAAFPMPAGRGSVLARAVFERAPVQIPDVMADPDYLPKEAMRKVGYRGNLGVPMIRDGEVIGSIGVCREEPGLFADKHVRLLQIFADQAVIAIENVRLFKETQEALQQQKASAEVLAVIGSSVADTKPVFDKILDSCKHLFGGEELDVLLVDAQGQLQVAAYVGNARDAVMATFPAPVAGSAPGRAITEGRIAHYVDVMNDPATPPVLRRMGQVAGYHSVAFAPMLWEGRGIGVVGVARSRGAFSDKELSLLQTFADQAVIAIQNARLFNETKEALARQTATADVLRVLGSSMTETQPVFDAIVKNGGDLLRGSRVVLWLSEANGLRARASNGGLPKEPIPIDHESPVGACVADARTIHLPSLDAAAEEYPRLRQLGLGSGFHSGVYAPLLRNGVAIGGLAVLRRESGAFDAKDVALVGTFADQAVIAVENVRMFHETREALERQTATAEILRVISSSVTDSQPVFDAIVTSCQRLFGGKAVNLLLAAGEMLKRVAMTSDGALGLDRVDGWPLDRASVSGECVVAARVVVVPDSEAVFDQFPRTRALATAIGWRSGCSFRCCATAERSGASASCAGETGGFDPKDIALAQTFADQAVIAIENVRLFNETKEALEQQTATAEILRVISGSVTDTQPVFDAIVQSCRACSAARRCTWRCRVAT